jgi:RNA polymerase sigma-70 factor (ECF subfamily)
MTDFHSLYEKYARDVRRFALLLCGNEALADDLTSETFVRVWTARGEIRQSTVKGYLFTIVRNLFRDHWRREKRWIELEDHVPDRTISPHIRSEKSSELRDVLRNLQKLPEQERAALLMYAEEEMSYREIADALGLSLAGVKVKIHRARLKLLEASTADANGAIKGVKI